MTAFPISAHINNPLAVSTHREASYSYISPPPAVSLGGREDRAPGYVFVSSTGIKSFHTRNYFLSHILSEVAQEPTAYILWVKQAPGSTSAYTHLNRLCNCDHTICSYNIAFIRSPTCAEKYCIDGERVTSYFLSRFRELIMLTYNPEAMFYVIRKNGRENQGPCKPDPNCYFCNKQKLKANSKRRDRVEKLLSKTLSKVWDCRPKKEVFSKIVGMLLLALVAYLLCKFVPRAKGVVEAAV